MDLRRRKPNLEIPDGPRRNAPIMSAQRGVLHVQESDPLESVPSPGHPLSATDGPPTPVSLIDLRRKHRLLAEEGRAEYPLFQYYVSPATYNTFETKEEFEAAANEYFERCFLTKTPPRLNGLALALGCPGPASLQRLAMRKPELREIISRCLTAVANAYECVEGNSVLAMFMLKHIPEFDVLEPEGTAPLQYFKDRQEVNVYSQVTGVIDHSIKGAHLSPREAYYRLIHQRDALPDDIIEAEVVEAKPLSIEDLLAREETLFEDDE
jgi:hypothetical protein